MKKKATKKLVILFFLLLIFELAYNPHKIPPDISLSIKHGIAKRIAKIEEKKHKYEEVCECCGFPLVKKSLKFY